MTEVYTIFGGDMWRQVFNGVVTILGASTFDTLLRIVGLFGYWAWWCRLSNRATDGVPALAGGVQIITSALLAPKRSVQIIDITDSAGVYEVDNVPLGWR
jgi:conjugal transfer mating pair stabilization protein TraG